MTGRAEPAVTRIPRSAMLLALVLLALVSGACAAGRASSRAESAARVGDWDAAVTHFTRAVQADPNRPEYRIGLQRAMENASMDHLRKARVAESRGQLDVALREYRKASEYDPLNGELGGKVIEIERAIRDRIEAAQPRPRIEQLREQARLASPEPALNPASRQPIDVTFNSGVKLADILKFLSSSTGINITVERDTQRLVDSTNYGVELHDITLEQALHQILTANRLFYKVLDPHTILVIQDTPTNRMNYEEQAIQTFYVSHADASELFTLLNTVVRPPGMTNPPTVQVNKSANALVVRATPAVLRVIEQLIRANDRPRAELVIDVEILEISRTRAKQYGLDLNDYMANFVFSPEGAPGTSSSGTGTTGTTTSSAGATRTNLMNLNSLRGITRGDFYLSIPAAIVRLLETDSETKLVAKPQLRGSEGEKLSLNLGSQIPVPSTTFGSMGAGGINTVPISSFTLKEVGLNFTIEPRVTYDGDIILTLTLENSTYTGTIALAGQDLPTFGQRKVSTRLRLRDGEPNLLAGLLQSNDSNATTGFPGLLRLPFLKQVFSGNKTQSQQTDIVMLLTPHIIRGHELSVRDVSPIYIGTSQNMGLSGPPPLIAPPPGGAGDPPPAAAGAPPPAAGALQPSTAKPATPAGTGAPGAVSTPPTPAPAAQPQAAQPTTTGGALVAASVSGPEFRVGAGPYTVPLVVSGASGLSTMSLTVRFNPAVLKVRSVQEGSFMQSGGAKAGFAQQVDATNGRVDITLTRTGDTVGAAGGGPLAALVFDAVAPGSSTLAVSGVATGPGGAAVPLQFASATVIVK